ILKLFNPDLVGGAKNKTRHKKPHTLNETGFNLAVTGANSYEFPAQARNLIHTLKTYPGINFAEDWKLVTIFIGANDLCDYCKNKLGLWGPHTMVFRNLPRAIINMVQLIHLEELRVVNDGSFGCWLQRSFCSCLVKPAKNSTELQELLDQNNQFQVNLEYLIGSGRYDEKNDFAVVLQPFLKTANAPRDENGTIDYSYFTLDCFHFTVKGHEQLAKGLWNNMLHSVVTVIPFQPEGAKVEIQSLSNPIQLICPPVVSLRLTPACLKGPA
uniref:Uncharacterized protein n=1 Tax=Latimeria chalumnae TaxID=7897 RepID=H3B5Q4_LATCH